MPLAENIALRSEFERFLEQNVNKELLRFTTAGSVDDGKSTLIGRLLHDSQTVYEDQLASIKKSKINRSNGPIDFSLLTDGLRAEREQGITIDVGYRYFSTARRKFIIADTPGHEQYTRNMATGASTADLAVVLIDGAKGLLPQTMRHAYIARLLAIPNVIAAVNKMDAVGYDEERFLALEQQFLVLAERLGIPHVQCIPISALRGDNVVERSAETAWYTGPTLLEHLETVPIVRPSRTTHFRFPVQCVIRPDGTFRGFAGQIAGGIVRPGDAVIALPSGQQSRVHSIVTYDGSLAEAFSPMSVTLTLVDEIDLSRGDMLVSPETLPQISQYFTATVVWMHTQPLEIGRTYLLKHTTRQLRAKVGKIRDRVNVNTLEREPAERLHLNDIASVELQTSSPLFFDSYQLNRTTGSFILIDPMTNGTLAAGMIGDAVWKSPAETPVLLSENRVDLHERYRRHGHYPAILVVVDTPEIAERLERTLFEQGLEVILIDREKTAPTSTLAGCLALYDAGFVVICPDSSVTLEEKLELQTLAGHHFFNLTSLNFYPAEGSARVQSLVDSIRIPVEHQSFGGNLK